MSCGVLVAVMGTARRPKLLGATLGRLVSQLPEVCLAHRPRLYFAGQPGEELLGQPFDVVPIRTGKPYLAAFWRVIVDAAELGAELLFLESDVWLGTGALRGMVKAPVPWWAGCLSFFDFRNDRRTERYWAMPLGREFWGTQAVLVPGPVVLELAELVRRNVHLDRVNSWDTWLGFCVELLGYRVGLRSPSLVQHIGMTSENSPAVWIAWLHRRVSYVLDEYTT